MARQYAPRETAQRAPLGTGDGMTMHTGSIGQGNQATQDALGITGTGAHAPDEAWIHELLGVAPVAEMAASGRWAGVQERVRRQNDLISDATPPQQGGSSDLMARLNALRAALESDQLDGVKEAASALADAARALIADGQGDIAALQEIIAGAGEVWTSARDKQSMQLGITASGREDLSRLASAASRPWYSYPMGKCYRAVAGYDSSSYMNRAGGRWKQLADRIPGSHAEWAVSFAHWLQETAHGQRAASDLGFEIRESDGRTRLGDYLAQRPELKGAIVVIPFGQEGTHSQDFNAADHYGDAKWGAGVGDISVVTEISGHGATYVADAKIRHDNATMWWVVYPK